MKKSDIFLIVSISILILAYIFIKIFTDKSEKVLVQYAKRKSVNDISTIINNSINEILYKNNYEEIITIDKNNNDEITNINFNNKKINNILYLFTKNILDTLDEMEKYNKLIYYIPSGVIYSLPILVNIGPEIPFKIDVLGDINNDSNIEIKEYGINSSIVEVSMKINLQIQVILPFVSQTQSVDKKIILDSKIIQGKIPNYYGSSNYLLNKE